MPRKKATDLKIKAKFQRTLMQFNKCMNDKTLKQIRKTRAYRELVPFGREQHKSNAYHFGKKSSMRKGDLCQALSNPKTYHATITKNFGTGKRTGPNKIKNSAERKRFSRLGNCTPASGPNKRTAPCTGKFQNEGITTTAKKCCFKKKMSPATIKKREANKKRKLSEKKRYNNTKSNQGKKKRGLKRKKEKK